jgi:hypothetical protein
MKTFRLLTVLFLFASPLAATAADAALSDADCAALLERWATDPKAAPKAVINACKEQLAQSAAEPVATATARIAATDPCAGPGAADSVLCWGPWASVAPAAGFRADPAQPPLPDREVCDARTEQCQPLVAAIDPPPPPPDPPLGSCTPGTPCGFATIVNGTAFTADAEDTEFGRFDMASDSSQFSVTPESGEDNIESVTMITYPDGPGYIRAKGSEGDLLSRLNASVEQDGDGQALTASDLWAHGTRETPRSGHFAWGIATSQTGLDTLNAGNVSLNFEGAMQVDPSTFGSMTIAFGTNPTWTGTWTNPGYSFGAGGTVSGADLISEPGQFTSNVNADQSFVQGGLVGEQGAPRGITHIIDVTIEGQDRIKDVGLLHEVIATSAITP